jgi:4-amino-4-deoxy-L-arabinose transferase-like glycosyltransferase
VTVLSPAVPRTSRWPLAVFFLALVSGLAMVLVAFPKQGLVDTRFDPYYFGEMGKSLARGEGFLPYGNLIQRRAPLYPLLIGGLYWVFGEHPLLVQLVQCLLLAGTCLLVYDIGVRLFNERTGLLASVACALHPMMLRYVADLHLETLLIFLFTLMLWCLLRFHERPTLANGALAGATAALASLTKAVALPYPGVFAVGVVATSLAARRRDRKSRPPWAELAAMFVVMGALILPWTIRNYRANRERGRGHRSSARGRRDAAEDPRSHGHGEAGRFHRPRGGGAGSGQRARPPLGGHSHRLLRAGRASAARSGAVTAAG